MGKKSRRQRHQQQATKKKIWRAATPPPLAQPQPQSQLLTQEEKVNKTEIAANATTIPTTVVSPTPPSNDFATTTKIQSTFAEHVAMTTAHAPPMAASSPTLFTPIHPKESFLQENRMGDERSMPDNDDTTTMFQNSVLSQSLLLTTTTSSSSKTRLEQPPTSTRQDMAFDPSRSTAVFPPVLPSTGSKRTEETNSSVTAREIASNSTTHDDDPMEKAAIHSNTPHLSAEDLGPNERLPNDRATTIASSRENTAASAHASTFAEPERRPLHSLPPPQLSATLPGEDPHRATKHEISNEEVTYALPLSIQNKFPNATRDLLTATPPPSSNTAKSPIEGPAKSTKSTSTIAKAIDRSSINVANKEPETNGKAAKKSISTTTKTQAIPASATKTLESTVRTMQTATASSKPVAGSHSNESPRSLLLPKKTTPTTTPKISNSKKSISPGATAIPSHAKSLPESSSTSSSLNMPSLSKIPNAKSKEIQSTTQQPRTNISTSRILSRQPKHPPTTPSSNFILEDDDTSTMASSVQEIQTRRYMKPTKSSSALPKTHKPSKIPTVAVIGTPSDFAVTSTTRSTPFQPKAYMKPTKASAALSSSKKPSKIPSVSVMGSPHDFSSTPRMTKTGSHDASLTTPASVRRTTAPHSVSGVSVFDRLYHDAKVRKVKQEQKKAALLTERKERERSTTRAARKRAAVRGTNRVPSNPSIAEDHCAGEDQDSVLSSLHSPSFSTSQTPAHQHWNYHSRDVQSVTSEDRRKFFSSSYSVDTNDDDSVFSRLYANDYACSASKRNQERESQYQYYSTENSLSRRVNYRPSPIQIKHPVFFRPHADLSARTFDAGEFVSQQDRDRYAAACIQRNWKHTRRERIDRGRALGATLIAAAWRGYSHQKQGVSQAKVPNDGPTSPGSAQHKVVKNEFSKWKELQKSWFVNQPLSSSSSEENKQKTKNVKSPPPSPPRVELRPATVSPKHQSTIVDSSRELAWQEMQYEWKGMSRRLEAPATVKAGHGKEEEEEVEELVTDHELEAKPESGNLSHLNIRLNGKNHVVLNVDQAASELGSATYLQSLIRARQQRKSFLALHRAAQEQSDRQEETSLLMDDPEKAGMQGEPSLLMQSLLQQQSGPEEIWLLTSKPEERKILDDASVLIQSQWRGSTSRARYSEQQASTLMLQSLVRGGMARQVIKREEERSKKREEELREQNMFSIKIQAHWRRQCARANFRERRAAALSLQAMFWSSVALQRFREQKSSASLLQGVARGFLAKKSLQLLKAESAERKTREIDASLKIQSIYRSHASRSLFLEKRRQYQQEVAAQNYREAEACTKIQNIYRSQVAQSIFRDKLRSAITIQAWWRCYVRRCKYVEIRSASMQLQSVVRSVQAMSSFRERKRATVQLQSLARRAKAKDTFARKRTAARSVQRFWVQLQRRKSLHDAVVRIQSRYRLLEAQNMYHQRRGAILSMQSMARCYLAKLELQSLRDEKERELEIECQEREINDFAATLIQARWREYWESWSFRQRRAAAITLQARSRGSLCRKQLLQQKTAQCLQKQQQIANATKIQKTWRRTLARNHLWKSCKSAIVLQASIRAFAARRKFHDQVQQAKEHNAASSCIQTVWRATSARGLYRHQRASAITLQALARGLLAKGKLSENKRALVQRNVAATRIQSKWKARLTLIHYLRQQRHIGVLQCAMRGFLWRKRQKNHSATRIQAEWRRFSAQTTFRNQRNSAICLQSRARGLLNRKHVQEERNQHVASAKIQALARVYILRKRYDATMVSVVRIQSATRGGIARQYLETKRRESCAAKSIQAVCRGHAARSQYSHKRRCAITLQSMTRRVLAHSNVVRALHKKQAQDTAATKIQCLWRSRKARCHSSTMRSKTTQDAAAVRLQAFWRGMNTRKEFRRRTFAVVRLQSWARAICARQSCSLQDQDSVERRAAVRIQRTLRGHQQRQQRAKEQDAATKISHFYILWKTRELLRRFQCGTVLLCRGMDSTFALKQVGPCLRSRFASSLKVHSDVAVHIETLWGLASAKVKECATVILQRHLRGVLVRSRLKRRLNCALILQHSFRNFLNKRKGVTILSRLFEEAKQEQERVLERQQAQDWFLSRLEMRSQDTAKFLLLGAQPEERPCLNQLAERARLARARVSPRSDGDLEPYFGVEGILSPIEKRYNSQEQ